MKNNCTVAFFLQLKSNIMLLTIHSIMYCSVTPITTAIVEEEDKLYSFYETLNYA